MSGHDLSYNCIFPWPDLERMTPGLLFPNDPVNYAITSNIKGLIIFNLAVGGWSTGEGVKMF